MADRILGLDASFRVAGKYGPLDPTYGDVLKSVLLSFKTSFTGDGTAQWADRVYAATGTCGESTHRATVSLYGVLEDDFGGAIDLDELVGLFVENTSTEDGYDIWLRAGVTNPVESVFMTTDDRVLIKKGGAIGMLTPVDGFSINSGAYNLSLEAAGDYNASWKLMLIGRNQRA